jgi:hypothetical protein
MKAFLTIIWPNDANDARLGLLRIDKEVLKEMNNLYHLQRTIELIQSTSRSINLIGIYFHARNSKLHLFEEDHKLSKRQRDRLYELTGEEPSDNFYELLTKDEYSELEIFERSDYYSSLTGQTDDAGIIWDYRRGRTAHINWEILLAEKKRFRTTNT